MRIVTEPFELTLEERAELQLPLYEASYRRAFQWTSISTAASAFFVWIIEMSIANEVTDSDWAQWVRALLWLALIVSIYGVYIYSNPKPYFKKMVTKLGLPTPGDSAVIEINDEEWKTTYLSGISNTTPVSMIFRMPGDSPIIVVLGDGRAFSQIPRRALKTDEQWLEYIEWASALPVSPNLSNPRLPVVSQPKKS